MNQTLIRFGIIILFLAIVSFFQGCSSDKNRKHHKHTYNVGDTLYEEVFSTFEQGAWGGGRMGDWLTDSTNFRIFIGAFDEVDGRITIECKNDTVFVTQFPDDLDVNKHLKAPATRTYLLNDLKKMNNLNDYFAIE